MSVYYEDCLKPGQKGNSPIFIPWLSPCAANPSSVEMLCPDLRENHAPQAYAYEEEDCTALPAYPDTAPCLLGNLAPLLRSVSISLSLTWLPRLLAGSPSEFMINACFQLTQMSPMFSCYSQTAQVLILTLQFSITHGCSKPCRENNLFCSPDEWLDEYLKV